METLYLIYQIAIDLPKRAFSSLMRLIKRWLSWIALSEVRIAIFILLGAIIVTIIGRQVQRL